MPDYSQSSDSELTAAIRDGDALAFKELHQRFFHRLYHFIWQKTRSGELANDLTQELYARVWKHRETLDPARSIKAYLYRIGNNLVINYANKRANEIAYLSSLSQESYITGSGDDRFDLRDKIDEALSSLPEKQRSVFMLNRFEAFTYSEIAECMQISVKTVEKYMSQALRHLREKLAAYR